MSEQTPKIDPRYRPEFQRGGASAPPSLRPEPIPPVVTVGMPPAASSRPVAPPPPPASAPTRAAAGPAASAPDLVEVEPLGRPRARWFNPFIILLWVLSVGIIIGGAAVYQWAVSDMYLGGSYGPDGDIFVFVTRQMLVQVTPYVVVTGIAGILGLLFWHATRWHERRR